jgi:hypothetical protein
MLGCKLSMYLDGNTADGIAVQLPNFFTDSSLSLLRVNLL